MVGAGFGYAACNLGPALAPLRNAPDLDEADGCLHFQHTPICAKAFIRELVAGRILALVDRFSVLAVVLVRLLGRPQVAVIGVHRSVFPAFCHDHVLAERPGTHMPYTANATPLEARDSPERSL
jgi:hypothetical protein